MRERKNAYSILVGKSEGKRILRRARCTGVDNIKMDIAEIGWGIVDWVCVVQDRNK
jgi:hypothetical protein